jgi:hypothetical protein
MDDRTSNANRFDSHKRLAALTTFGLDAFKPIMSLQVSMLRMWADSIERFAGNYEKGVEETVATVKEQEHVA